MLGVLAIDAAVTYRMALADGPIDIAPHAQDTPAEEGSRYRMHHRMGATVGTRPFGLLSASQPNAHGLVGFTAVRDVLPVRASAAVP